MRLSVAMARRRMYPIHVAVLTAARDTGALPTVPPTSAARGYRAAVEVLKRWGALEQGDSLAVTDFGLALLTLPDVVTQTESDRFWEKVDRSSGDTACWPWRGARNSHGYGRFQVRGDRGKRVMAHRIAYQLTHGEVPHGLQLDHLCRNRTRCNPAHLEPVSNRENTLRGTGRPAVNAAKTQCPSGHPYDARNTYMDPRGGRQCRECRRLKLIAARAAAHKPKGGGLLLGGAR